jgi:hypothetical protein
MAIGRRNFILGAGGVLALAGAGTAWRVTRMPETAAAPWAFDPAPLPDVRLDAFRYAILAPNPHNRQPWLIRMEGEDAAVLTIDLAKRLPETDPFDRQLTIGFGTFIELACIAAAERGARVEVTPFPDGEPQPRLDTRPIARLTFVRDATATRDPLFAAIPLRRTNRTVYSGSPTAAQLASLAGEGAVTSTDPTLIAGVRAIAVAAIEGEIRDAPAFKESIDLMRIGHAEIDANPDGIALSGPMIEATNALGLTTRAALSDPTSTAFSIGLDDARTTYGSVPAAVWINTAGNSRAEQLDAGRRYARVSLRAAALGLAMHPMSQSLQEYAAMKPHYDAIHALLAKDTDERIQMLARVGVAGPVDPAPRWPLATHIVT